MCAEGCRNHLYFVRPSSYISLLMDIWWSLDVTRPGNMFSIMTHLAMQPVIELQDVSYSIHIAWPFTFIDTNR